MLSSLKSLSNEAPLFIIQLLKSNEVNSVQESNVAIKLPTLSTMKLLIPLISLRLVYFFIQ